MKSLMLAFYMMLVLPVAALAGGDAPAPKGADDPATSKSGTNVSGQSGDFESYLNEGKQTKESNTLDLVDLGQDAKIAAGGDDPELGVKMGFE